MSAATSAPPPPAEHFEAVSRCLLCGGEDAAALFAEPPFEIRRCPSCQLVWVSPRLRREHLPGIYGADYWQSERPRDRGYADYRADAALYRRTFRARLRLLQRFVPRPGRGLDVGCAAGFFLEVLREAGWSADGVELSPEIARHAQALPGAGRVYVGELEELPLEVGAYDLVTLWDVVEHVPDPVKLLARARELLKPDGVLVLETQNVASAFARLLGPRWQHYKHLEHLYHFNPASIEGALTAAGLSPLYRTARYGGKHVSLGFVRERAARLHPGLARILTPLAPLDHWSGYVNLFDEMIVVARSVGERAREFEDDSPEAS